MQIQSYGNITRWLWKTWKGYRTQAFINTLVGMIVVLTDLAFVWCTKVAVDIATSGSRHGLQLWHVMLMLVGVVFVQVSMTVANRWIRAILGVRGQNRMQEHFLSACCVPTGRNSVTPTRGTSSIGLNRM